MEVPASLSLMTVLGPRYQAQRSRGSAREAVSDRPFPMSSRNREEDDHWQDKYDRLHASHQRLQQLNQTLEDKLLKLVERFQGEKSALTRDISDLTGRLVEARLALSEVQEENEQYRTDCNVAVQLLQCKPSSFVASKLSSLPNDLQDKVKSLLTRRKRAEPPRTIKVEVGGSGAMLYAVARTRGGSDYVSAAVLAKALEERAKERRGLKKCPSCLRFRKVSDVATQTTTSIETDI